MQQFKYKPPLNTGKLNRRIVFQKYVPKKDEAGFPSKDKVWETQFALYASREPLRGREYFAASAAQAENTVRFKMRYSKDKQITSNMRLVDGERVYDIKAVLDDVYGDRTQTHIMAVERTNG